MARSPPAGRCRASAHPEEDLPPVGGSQFTWLAGCVTAVDPRPIDIDDVDHVACHSHRREKRDPRAIGRPIDQVEPSDCRSDRANPGAVGVGDTSLSPSLRGPCGETVNFVPSRENAATEVIVRAGDRGRSHASGPGSTDEDVAVGARRSDLPLRARPNGGGTRWTGANPRRIARSPRSGQRGRPATRALDQASGRATRSGVES